MTFKVGDRVRTEDGEGEVLSIQDEVFEVSVFGETEWFYADYEIELVTDSTPAVSQLDIERISALGEQLGISSFEQSVRYHTNKIADLLIAKNKAYGDSALNPVRIFSRASRIEQLNVRIDDKISRIQRGTDFGDEDTVRDLIGYLVLRLIAEESE